MNPSWCTMCSLPLRSRATPHSSPSPPQRQQLRPQDYSRALDTLWQLQITRGPVYQADASLQAFASASAACKSFPYWTHSNCTFNPRLRSPFCRAAGTLCAAPGVGPVHTSITEWTPWDRNDPSTPPCGLCPGQGMGPDPRA